MLSASRESTTKPPFAERPHRTAKLPRPAEYGRALTFYLALPGKPVGDATCKVGKG
jgi:hypothetical protein